MIQRPSNAFIGASWVAMITGFVTYVTGLWNAPMTLTTKGFYFTILMFALFAGVSLQKAVRDRMEGIPVTPIYYGISWFSTALPVLLLIIGLWNAHLPRFEKGYYAMSFLLTFFASIAVQKNVRDCAAFDKLEEKDHDEHPHVEPFLTDKS